MRVIGDDGVIYTAALAALPVGTTDNEGNLDGFETIVYPSGRTLEYLQAQFGSEIYVIRDPA